MATGRQEDDEGKKGQTLLPGAFASREEFDEARKNLALYLATLDGWTRSDQTWLMLKKKGKADFSLPSVN